MWEMPMTKEKILESMTLKEKIAYCSGEDVWHTKKISEYGIDSIMMADGPHGLRKQENASDILGLNESIQATSFPTASITACSFDVKLLEKMGEAISLEAKNNEVSVILGPGVNIKRNPLCGRNFEYFSEDPHLAGKMGAAFVKGVQNTGIGTCVKHFALNNQEYKRFSSDSIVDERTMREIYLAPFECVVKEGKPDTVMCAYNKVNGTYCSGNKWLLTDVLRKEWGFDGVVVTDWGAMNDRIESFKAGCDLCMPGGSAYMEPEALKAAENGVLSEKDIDASVSRILRLVEKKTALFKNFKIPSKDEKEKILENHYQLARQIARESAVLLKNEDNILPVKEEQVAFIGYMAKELRYQGAGSSHINPWKLGTVTEVCPNIPFAEGYNKFGDTTGDKIKKAVELAGSVNKVVVFAGLPDAYESEGFDREHMQLPKGHLDLIDAVATVNSNVIVVLFGGGAVEVPFENKVKAILYMGLPGEAGGEAVCDILFGKANPCGKLAETWPLKYEDCVCSDYYGRKDAWYQEGVYVGYRYYLSANVPVKYPFGHGLSYTRFEYSDLLIEGNTITCTVKNVGVVKGKEIVQLYIEPLQKNAYRPLRELKAFEKVELEAGQSTIVSFELTDRSFAIWKNSWIVPNGQYIIGIGKDCQDIVLSAKVEKDGEEMPYIDSPGWYTAPCDSPSQNDFEQLLRRKIENKQVKKGEYTMENTIIEMKDDSFLMKIIFHIIEIVMARKFDGKRDYRNPSFKMMVMTAADCSLSGVRINAKLKNYLVEGLLEIANGHFFKGVKKMMKRIK